jgi:membrane dipeptidase
MINRRETLGLGVAAALTAGPARSRQAATRPLIVNALGGLSDPNLELGAKSPIRPGGAGLNVDDRVIADAHRAGLCAINVTLGYVSGPDEPHAATLASLDAWDALIAANPKDLTRILHPGDFGRARDEGKIGLIYGFQNSVQVGEHLEHVDEYAARGVKVIQITYNDRNIMGGGSVAPAETPLTPLGHALVEKLNAAKIMVDLSHSGRRTCLDAIAASRAPVSINHTGCRALNDLPRNKSDEELLAVAQKGGFVGIYFMPFLAASGHPRAADAADHIVHALGVCGEDHVGIGTDGDPTGIDDLATYKTALAKEVAARVAAGVSAKGERPDTYPFVVELRGPGQYQRIAELLADRGVRARAIDKVLGANFVEYARRVWG